MQFIISQAARRRLQRTEMEMARLFSLPDRWLAEELLKLARNARREFPNQLGNPYAPVYDAALVWQVVPVLARRLGATRLQPNEARDRGVTAKTPVQLRLLASGCILNTEIGAWARGIRDLETEMPSACEILAHEVENGNPVAMAMDRLSPPLPAGDIGEDRVSRLVRECSRNRRHPETWRWTPDLQRPPETLVPDEEPAFGMAF